jgi:hypothetical protein
MILNVILNVGNVGMSAGLLVLLLMVSLHAMHCFSKPGPHLHEPSRYAG